MVNTATAFLASVVFSRGRDLNAPLAGRLHVPVLLRQPLFWRACQAGRTAVRVATSIRYRSGRRSFADRILRSSLAREVLKFESSAAVSVVDSRPFRWSYRR